ncbi:MAG: Peptidoglycan glycosyltransferase MrdB [Fimbriimonadaceae bacterium]|nr:Peptidoglycan glycosyltransferase MrdB [Fimbriimonadaceae bacterium]
MSSLGEAKGPLVERGLARGLGFDWWLLASSLILLTIGVMSLYSIDYDSANSRTFLRHMQRLAVGVIPFAFVFFLNLKALVRYANAIYVLNLILLLLVLLIGSSAGGAQRWINLGPIDFQPSEMAKLFTIITLSAFLANNWDRIRSARVWFLSLLHVLVPLLLIFKQPHLGASLVMLAIWLGISLVAGVPAKLLLATVLGAAGILSLAFLVPGVLRDYQKERVMAMFGGDERNNRYQTSRAEIAIGVGSLTGVGYLKGEHKRAGYVPAQHTDFIFTVIGEEGGLVGSTLLLCAFGMFFYRIWLLMIRATEPFHRLLVAGVFSMLAFHMTVNLGMNLELLPVVGLWLPFMSYGGTAIWLCLACVGLLLNISARERPVLFS